VCVAPAAGRNGWQAVSCETHSGAASACASSAFVKVHSCVCGGGAVLEAVRGAEHVTVTCTAECWSPRSMGMQVVTPCMPWLAVAAELVGACWKLLCTGGYQWEGWGTYPPSILTVLAELCAAAVWQSQASWEAL
jgi:hypothetical protein